MWKPARFMINDLPSTSITEVSVLGEKEITYGCASLPCPLLPHNFPFLSKNTILFPTGYFRLCNAPFLFVMRLVEKILSLGVWIVKPRLNRGFFAERSWSEIPGSASVRRVFTFLLVMCSSHYARQSLGLIAVCPLLLWRYLLFNDHTWILTNARTQSWHPMV